MVSGVKFGTVKYNVTKELVFLGQGLVIGGDGFENTAVVDIEMACFGKVFEHVALGVSADEVGGVCVLLLGMAVCP